MLKDPVFKLPSEQATAALSAATSLMEWCSDAANKTAMTRFSTKLVRYLEQCFSSQLNRESLWRQFNSFRISKNHFILWDNFLRNSIKKGGPIFFQFITSHIFKHLIKHKYPTMTTLHETSTAEHVADLTEEEMCVIRYAAGFIPRNLIPKVERSAHSNKTSLKMCLMDIVEEDGMGDDESSEWTREVNRGGLKEVTNEMFKFVCAMEMVVKEYLIKEERSRTDAWHEEVTKLIEDSKRVKIHWDEVASEWEAEDSELLFKMVTNLWVTMRGFGYVSMWMEKWKQENKSTTQKSKGLRKTLNEK